MVSDDKLMIRSPNKPYDKTWINMQYLHTNKPYKTLINLKIKNLNEKSYDNKQWANGEKTKASAMGPIINLEKIPKGKQKHNDKYFPKQYSLHVRCLD